MKNAEGDRLNHLFIQNLANAVTMAGIIFAFWLLITALTDPDRLWFIALLAGITGLTDFIDGRLARHLKITSWLGELLDRLRDKIFICPTLVFLGWHYWNTTFQSIIAATFTLALVAAILLIELLLIIGLFLALKKSQDISSNQWGKIKMFLQFFVVMFWLLSLMAEKYFGLPIMRFSIYFIDAILLVVVYYGAKSLEGYYLRYTQKK